MTPQSPRFFGSHRFGAVLLAAFLLVGLLPGAVSAAPATKLVITPAVPASQTSGQVINVTVQAQDGASAIDAGFTGTVMFVTSDGAATVSPASGYTYTAGDAGTKTFAVILRSFGNQTFSFQSSGLTSTPTQTVNVTASRLVFTVTPSGGASGAVWATQPDVAIQDETSATVTTSTATIALAVGTNPSGGALTGCANLTAVAGVVNVSGCKIDKAGTGYTLVATSSGLTSGTSGPFNITPGPATKLAFSTQPARGIPGGALAAQPVVEVQDAAGNRVTGDSTTNVTLALSAGGTLTCSGGLAKQAVSGLVTFIGCSINNVGVGYQITATAGGLTSAVSSLFDVSDRVVFTTQPSTTSSAGIAFASQPVVEVRAGAASTATHDQATVVTLSIKAGTGAAGATLTCTGGLSKTVVNGIATFAGCKIDKISPTSRANPYKIVASATNLTSAESTNVAITAGPASKLGFTAQPNAGVAAQAFPIQPVVAVQDAGGNTVTSGTNSTATVTLSLGAGAPVGAVLTCTGGLSKVAVAGVATFAGCAINAAGTYTLVATASNLAAATTVTSATSNSFVVTAPGATITLTTSAPIPPGAQNPVILWGQGFTLTVQFGTNGAGKTFQLQGTRDLLTWTTITTLTTDASGRASLFYTPVTNLYYRAVFAGTPDLAAANSNQVRTVVRQLALLRPTNSGSVKSIGRNSSITFTTTVRPARPELALAKVSFYFYRFSSGAWRLVTKRDVFIDGAGLARTTFKFTSSGQWYVRSQANPTTYNANSILTPVERYSVR